MARKKNRLDVLFIRTTWRILLILCFFTIVSDFAVKRIAQHRIHTEIGTLPKNRVGLLLGTAKYVARNKLNLYYIYRIEAAVKLYENGKIDFILVSGDNGSISYDEPTTMKNDLVARGIPASRIYLDYAGFRTLDSVVRAKEIFGQSSFTIISQRFHNERAIVLCKLHGINAVGYCARDVKNSGGIKTKARELLARNKMFLDSALGKRPKFLGERIDIN